MVSQVLHNKSISTSLKLLPLTSIFWHCSSSISVAFIVNQHYFIALSSHTHSVLRLLLANLVRLLNLKHRSQFICQQILAQSNLQFNFSPYLQPLKVHFHSSSPDSCQSLIMQVLFFLFCFVFAFFLLLLFFYWELFSSGYQTICLYLQYRET